MVYIGVLEASARKRLGVQVPPWRLNKLRFSYKDEDVEEHFHSTQFVICVTNLGVSINIQKIEGD